MPEQTLAAPAVEEFAREFRGALLQPGDEGFDDARLVWNGIHDRHPALIARCTSPEDVVGAVNFARGHGLRIAVRGGGHSAPGYATCDDGIVIDLSPMNKVEVDPEAKTARAEAGTTWGEFDAATQEHGLAVTGGRFSTTGIAGLTLGSGSGWLERKCGLTADNLLSAEVVTAAGERVTASSGENPDLFWGIRGGSGNFGIVTSFVYRLHEVGPIIYGGLMMAMGSAVRGGFAADWPGCETAERVPANDNQGNLKVPTDYRSVYKAVIEEWFEGDAEAVIGGPPVDKLVRGDGYAGARRLFK